MLNYGMLTPYGKVLDIERVLPEYPRPQLVRDSYLNLNGRWGYSVNKTGDISGAPQESIVVPFPPESVLSGVRRESAKDEYLIYFKDFAVESGFIKDITLLHIGAADQSCEAFLNGIPVGQHEGGYLPFSFDVSGAIRAGSNSLVIRVRDGMNYSYPTGKQRKKRGGIWYTPVSGIWQTVWLESVSAGYVRDIRLTPDIDRRCVGIEIDSDSDSLEVTLTAGGRVISDTVTDKHSFELTITEAELNLWSPEQPFLYGLTVRAGADRVTSYFAMRKFTVGGRHFLLNNKPYFVNGLLDQGYFSDGIYTPASYDAYRDDIMSAKRLGFNTLRKHIKLEPMRFYFLCDTLGMLVLQDMVNVGRYSFFKDTILPFAGRRRGKPYINVNKKQREMFTSHCLATQKLLYNCPCVVYYTIFNEGWGQFDGDGLYSLLKDADPTRVYDATSGWFREKRSDVVSEHIYFKPIKLSREDRTVIVSEFGGYSYNCPGHVFNTDKMFGYRKFSDLQAFGDAFAALYENEVLPNIKNGLAGAIYTQLSDVEDETNGILTYDRQVCKPQPDRVLPLMRRICAAVEQYSAGDGD